MAQFWPQNKEWVDLEALENLRRSLLEYGTVGTTKCSTGKGKRLIIVDCITENGPVPGALWTFSAESKPKQEKEVENQFVETAVAQEKLMKCSKVKIIVEKLIPTRCNQRQKVENASH